MKPFKKRPSYNLTEVGIWRSIWAMSWPMVLIMSFQFLMGMVDIYAAGLLGPLVQASVGFSMQLFFILSVAANAMGMGTLSLVSRASGAGNQERIIEIARQSVFCSIVFSLIIALLLYLSSERIVSIAGLPSDIKELSTEMLKYYSLAIFNTYIITVSNAILRARGEARDSLVVLVSMNIINILLIFPLVFGMGHINGLGAIGLPIAMVISSCWGVALSLYMFTRRKWHGFYVKKINLFKEDIKDILSIGWPNAVTQIAWHTGTITLMSILARLGHDSVSAIAGMTNGLRVEAVIYLPAFALNMSASVLVGQSIGAGNKERAERIGWLIAFTGIVIVSLLSVIIFFLAPYIASQLSTDESVQREVVNYLRFNMPVEPLMALGVILAGAMQGAGDTRGVMKVIVICMWFIRIPLAWFLTVHLMVGAKGVWIAMIVSMACQGILLAIRFKRGLWYGR